MTRLTFDECPKTRVGFVKKFREDHIFRAKAQNMGFAVVGECVIFPNGRIADKHTKQCATEEQARNSLFFV